MMPGATEPKQAVRFRVTGLRRKQAQNGPSARGCRTGEVLVRSKRGPRPARQSVEFDEAHG